MKIAYNVKGKVRKQLVNIIAEAINEKAEYLGTPSYAYQIGDFKVNREGTLEFDSANTDEAQIKAIIDSLKENGFDYEGSDNLTMGFPLDGFSDESLENLRKMVATKETLIKTALGVDELPIEIGENEINFPWFSAGLSREELNAVGQFIAQLCKTAKDKKRVTAKAREIFENPKFSMRVWLISLGMVGGEFANARKFLMKNLSGNSGWRYSDGESKPRGERIHKEVISIRLTPETLETLTNLANQHKGNVSRNMLIESIISEYIHSEMGAGNTASKSGYDENETDGE